MPTQQDLRNIKEANRRLQEAIKKKEKEEQMILKMIRVEQERRKKEEEAKRKRKSEEWAFFLKLMYNLLLIKYCTINDYLWKCFSIHEELE